MKKKRYLFVLLAAGLLLTSCAAPGNTFTNGTQTEASSPVAVEDTLPSNLGFDIKMELDGKEISEYSRPEPVYFTEGSDYTDLEGILTFRGNNWRQGSSYGTVSMTEKKFDTNTWQVTTGALEKDYGSGEWTGSGWTGQPLIVKWPEETKQIMNIYEDKKAKEDLVEVIYATMDGNVYFLDLEDGTPTRDKLNVGFPFKGAGSLDPRGYPLLYLGPGDAGPEEGQEARYMIYSLIDFTKLYEFGESDSFAPRTSFSAFDSAPLVHAATDTLFEPAENGILYSIKLNTNYDPENGTISISPTEQLKWTYTTNRSNEETYWLGMEDSAVIWENYMYVADNAGDLMCIDLNTMELIWAQDVWDDTNGSPTLSVEDGIPYLYISTSLHWTASSGLFKRGDIPIFKINGFTGEIVWQRAYNCETVSGVSGGVQATGLVGQNNLSGLVFYPVARTPLRSTGQLVALDAETGEEVWSSLMLRYSWSSPVAVYDEDGNGYLIQCDSGGNMYLIDGLTGELLDKINLGSNIEATPAVYGNTIVVGTRGEKIYGIRLK